MIDLVFGREDNLRSKLIRWSTAGVWSHVWFELELFGQRWVVHSAADGVVLAPPGCLPAYTATTHVELPLAVPDLLEAVYGRVGAPYDYGVIPNALLLVLFRATGVVWFDPVRNANRYSCSELAALLLKELHLEQVAELDPELTTPQILADAVGAREA